MCRYGLSMHSEPCAISTRNCVPLRLRCGGVSAGGPNRQCPLRQSAVCLYLILARLAKKYIARPPEFVRKNPRKIKLRKRWHCRFPIVRRRVPLSLRYGTITRVPLHLRFKFWPCVATSALLGYIVCHSACACTNLPGFFNSN